MQKTIVSDTSCLIILEKIGQLELLQTLFGSILITSEVAKEFRSVIPAWISIQDPTDTNNEKVLRVNIDSGEASAIALALELDDCLLIMDDLKGRVLAEELGIRVTGTFGVIIEAKLAGHIASVKSLLEKIKMTNFRLSQDLEKKILTKSGEI